MDQLSAGRAKHFVDFVNLINLIFAFEEREFEAHFEKHASKAPHIHFGVIVAIGHEALGGPIPAGGDVLRVGVFAIDPLA